MAPTEQTFGRLTKKIVFLIVIVAIAAVAVVPSVSARTSVMPTGPRLIAAPAVTSLPSSRLEFGLANLPTDLGWMTASGVPWKYRYTYLAGGVNTANPWPTWQYLALPPGQFAVDYMNNSYAHGYIPVFTYYEMLQSLPSTGGSEAARDYSNLNNPGTMNSYFANFKLLMQLAGTFGKQVVVHVEPDLWAYLQQGAGTGDASTLTASVASSGFADVASMPNTVQGYAWALLHLRDVYAPNAVLGIHASIWSSGITKPDLTAAFLNSAGILPNTHASTWDVLFNDVDDHDAGWWEQYGNRWWKPADFTSYLAWVAELKAKTGIQQVVWQVPIGNQYFLTMNNTCGHYQDNVAPYFIAHASDLSAAGLVAVLLGAGNTCGTTYTDTQGDGITNNGGVPTTDVLGSCNACNTHTSVWPDDDGGYLRIFVGQYYAAASTIPTVGSLAPNSGPTAGGTPVVITGTNLTGATAVKFGTLAATVFTVNSATQITATSPPGSAGIVDVTVTTASGTSATGAADQFAYTGPPPTLSVIAPTSGPAGGGTPVVITGTNFTGATAVKFGTLAATTYTVNSDIQITATSPAGTGTVDLRVTTTGGTTPIIAADQFTYIPAPAVASVAPNTGLTGGGTPVTITGTNLTGATAVKFGTVNAATFAVASATQITATSPAGFGTVDVTVTTPGGISAMSAADRFTYTAPPAAYTAQSPNRILDTRSSAQTLGAGSSLNLTVAGGTTGVPASATGVVLNVTVTGTTAPSFLTVWPAGQARATVSNLNWKTGETRANLVNVSVGAGGQVSIYNGVGSADVVVDEEGYFAAPSGTAGGYNALPPARLLDTRPSQTMGTGSTIDLQVLGVGGVPAAGVSAVVLNATATNTASQGYFTLFPSGTSRPTASNVNWAAGWTIPNRVIVKVGANGKVSIYNGQGAADAVIDVSGYFTDSTATGKLFTQLSPVRILDTRLTGGTLGPNGTLANFQITGSNAVPAGASAVFLNTTVTNTTAPSFLTVYPNATKPTASDLNWVAGQTIPNLTLGTLSSSGATSFYNGVGSTDLVLDLSGYFS